MPLESQAELDEANAILKKEHEKKVKSNKLLPKLQQKPLRLSQRHQSYGCFCFQQHCHLQESGRGCVRCEKNGGPLTKWLDSAIGRIKKCTCEICVCKCMQSFNANKMQRIKTLRLFENRTEAEKVQDNPSSYKLIESINQAFDLPKKKTKDELLHATAHIFAGKECSREEQEELAQIVGKPTPMVTQSTHIANLDANFLNSRQYRGNLGSCASGVNELESLRYHQEKNSVKSPERRQLNFDAGVSLPGIISCTRKHITKEYVNKLRNESFFPSAEKRNYKSVMKKLQGKKKDEALVGIIVDSEPKTVEEAAKIALLCNSDDV